MDLNQGVLRIPHKSNARMPAHTNDPAARSKYRSPECVFEKAPLNTGLSVGEVCSEVPLDTALPVEEACSEAPRLAFAAF